VDILRSDMYLHHHLRHYMRELRLVAYNQVCGVCDDGLTSPPSRLVPTARGQPVLGCTCAPPAARCLLR
jgi:hypothetical protein